MAGSGRGAGRLSFAHDERQGAWEHRVKASGVIVVVGGVGALALLGLAAVLRPEAPEALPSVSGVRGPSSPPASRPGERPPGGKLPVDPGAALQAEGSVHRNTAPQDPAPPDPNAVLPSSGPPPEPSQAGSPPPGASGASGAGARTRVDEMVDLARQASREEDRVAAVRWLGENAETRYFDVLQDIQINDPSPAVRKAAEGAVNELRTRNAGAKWPGVTPVEDPQGYMRNVSPAP